METDAGIGDVEIPLLDVTPGDATTAGTLTVTAPDGTTTTPTVTPGTPASGSVRLAAAAVTFDQAGDWVLSWTVTGVGVGAEDQIVHVVSSPVAGGPTWTPGRSRVANYVPGRTLATDADTHELTFNSSTMPNGIMVDRLIADAVAWVTVRTGTIHTSLYDAASVTAAVFAASSVERGYPEQDQPDISLRRATDLLALATSLRTDLALANDAANGGNPNDPGSAVLPVWAFPAPVSWGDTLL